MRKTRNFLGSKGTHPEAATDHPCSTQLIGLVANLTIVTHDRERCIARLEHGTSGNLHTDERSSL